MADALRRPRPKEDQRRICFTLPDGVLCVSQIVRLEHKAGIPAKMLTASNERDSFAYGMEKTIFELYRPWLENLELTGEALEYWRANIHFDDFTGEIPITCREATTDDLPAERSQRSAWFDDISSGDPKISIRAA